MIEFAATPDRDAMFHEMCHRDFGTVIALLKTGDESAAVDLVRFFESEIRRLRCLKCISPDNVDDVLQETWIRGFQVLCTSKQVPTAAETRKLLFQIARGKVFDDLRKTGPKKTRPSVQSLSANPGAIDGIADKASYEPANVVAALEFVRAPLAFLDDEERQVYIMIRLDEMSQTETAEILGIDRSRVYRSYHSAMRKIEKWFKKWNES